ncbi:MAG: GGDEF domain-containing protein [Gammaproteobacteria bacterium]|nr:GGDEF domain-containing protein [Gammaproteobacteria bacterium]
MLRPNIPAVSMTRFASRWPLAIKTLIATVFISALAWFVTDRVIFSSLSNYFELQLTERLSGQAGQDRVHFYDHVQNYQHTAELFSEHYFLVKAVGDISNAYSKRGEQVLFHEQPPEWLPSKSVIRSLVVPRFLVLLKNGKAMEAYNEGSVPIPEAFLNAEELLHSMSEYHSYLTMINGEAYIVAGNKVKATVGHNIQLILASPIDEYFLNKSLQPGGSLNQVALVSEDSQTIMASTDAVMLKQGMSLEEIEQQYLVIGKGFFDDGDWDVSFSMVSLSPYKEVKKYTQDVLVEARKQQLNMVGVLVVVFMVLIYSLTRRVSWLTQQVSHFYKGIGMNTSVDLRKGDELCKLQNCFHYLAEEVYSQTAALEYQATHDDLTKLPNRAAMQQKLKGLLASEESGCCMSVFIMDLNKFKPVNDTYGHHIGDELLIEVAKRISTILPEGCTLYRLGGDEFALICEMQKSKTTFGLKHGSSTQCEVEEEITSIANLIAQETDKDFSVSDITLHIGISIGISIFPQHGDNSWLLMKHADIAMYKAKNNNSGYQVFNTKMLDRDNPFLEKK